MARHVDVQESMFEYTFSETELQDILGFMETHQHHTATSNDEPPVAHAAPPFVTTGDAMPLQFQPHKADSGLTPSHSTGSQAGDEAEGGALAVKREPADERPALNGDFSALNGLLSPKQSQHQLSAGLHGSSQRVNTLPTRGSDSQPLDTRAGSNAGSSAFIKKDSKGGHISHSTVEKQRRDRINALIDELRDMVPPQSQNSAAQDGMESKRPKHVVLSDTILLIRGLQDKARISDSPQPGETLSGAQDLFKKTYSDRSESDVRGAPASPPELPLAPEGAPPSSGVVVEQGDGCLYVKVNCKDRRGLLSDIISSLKAISLEITTAAVTTNGNGYVHDVFQVRVLDGSNYTAQDIQCHVHATMYNLEHNLGDKRRRRGA